MTQPTAMQADSNAQILIKLGEIGADVAVIKSTLSVLPDHENRLRVLERSAQQSAGSKDTASRIISILSGLVAAGAGIAAWLSLVHH